MRRALFLFTVFPHWAALHLDTVTLGEQQITREVSSTRRTAPCPDCRQRSHRAHSRFTRVLADLPLGDFPVRLHLHARRFHCGNPACVRRTFRERLPEVAPRYQRRTPALRHRLEAVGFALGGQAGRRLICRLRLAVTGASRNALLRLVRRAVLPGADQIAHSCEHWAWTILPSGAGSAMGRSWWILSSTASSISCLTARRPRWRAGWSSTPDTT